MASLAIIRTFSNGAMISRLSGIWKWAYWSGAKYVANTEGLIKFQWFRLDAYLFHSKGYFAISSGSYLKKRVISRKGIGRNISSGALTSFGVKPQENKQDSWGSDEQ